MSDILVLGMNMSKASRSCIDVFGVHAGASSILSNANPLSNVHVLCRRPNGVEAVESGAPRARKWSSRYSLVLADVLNRLVQPGVRLIDELDVLPRGM